MIDRGALRTGVVEPAPGHRLWAGGGAVYVCCWRAGRRPRAFRAPLAERSAVNRQVLGSIPSGGVPTRGSSVVEQWTVKCSMQRSIGREFKSPSRECFSIFGLVGYDARFTRERSRVRSSEDVVSFFFFPKFETEQPSSGPAHWHSTRGSVISG